METIEAESHDVKHFDTLPALVTAELILTHVLPIKRRTFWRWVAGGKFPPADMRIAGKARFWRLETVQNWLREQTGGGK
jgi:predicted DNA-binding transcriptional regulator AlpA